MGHRTNETVMGRRTNENVMGNRTNETVLGHRTNKTMLGHRTNEVVMALIKCSYFWTMSNLVISQRFNLNRQRRVRQMSKLQQWSYHGIVEVQKSDQTGD